MAVATVEEYLAAVDEPRRRELERVRRLVLELVPDAKERISYGMPSLSTGGQVILWYGAFRDHLSIFPKVQAIKDLADQLKSFTISKGTIQFTLEQPLPDEVIRAIVRHRLAAIAAS